MHSGATLKKAFLGYIVISGVVAFIAFVGGAVYALKYFQLTPAQLLVKAMEKSGLETDWVVKFIAPDPRFENHQFDGHIKTRHPRILLTQLSDWAGIGIPDIIAKRHARFVDLGIETYNPCNGEGILFQTACWVNTGDTLIADEIVVKLQKFYVTTSDPEDQYENAWELALVYDLLAVYPGFSKEKKWRYWDGI